MALRNLLGGIGLEETLQKIAQGIQQLSSSLGRVYPDTGGNLRTSVSGGALSSVGTITTITQMNSISTAYDQYAAMQTNAECVRSKIRVSP